MKLTIDGYPVEAQPGQSLLELTQALNLTGKGLGQRPLAAKSPVRCLR